MWELDHKEGWVLKNWCVWTIVVEKTLERSLDRKEIKPVNPKGDQPWIVIRRTDARVEVPIFGLLMWRVNSLEKTLMLGKTEGRRRRRQQKMQWLDGTTDSMGMSLSTLREMVKDREAWHAAVHGGPKSQTRLIDWKTTNPDIYKIQEYEWISSWNFLVRNLVECVKKSKIEKKSLFDVLLYKYIH